jgi:hypothetical protein
VTRPPYVRQIAAELELLSHGATTSFGESRPPHLAFLAEWDAKGDVVLERWNETLKSWKGGGKVRPAGVSEREIVLADGEGFSADDVAMRYRLTATMVRRWRVEDKRDGETGVPLRQVRERVRALRDAGKSYRAIGQELGRSKSQVERVDKAA